jgi:hypothetical protein
MFSCSLLTRLTLHKEGGRYYISYQEDFFHPDVSNFSFHWSVMVALMSCHVMSSHVARPFTQEFIGLIVPPLSKPVGLLLRFGGFACGLSARLAQAAFGIWSPRRDN